MAARVRVRDCGALAPPMGGTHITFEVSPSLRRWHVCSSKKQVHRWGHSNSSACFRHMLAPAFCRHPRPTVSIQYPWHDRQTSGLYAAGERCGLPGGRPAHLAGQGGSDQCGERAYYLAPVVKCLCATCVAIVCGELCIASIPGSFDGACLASAGYIAEQASSKVAAEVLKFQFRVASVPKPGLIHRHV